MTAVSDLDWLVFWVQLGGWDRGEGGSLLKKAKIALLVCFYKGSKRNEKPYFVYLRGVKYFLCVIYSLISYSVHPVQAWWPITALRQKLPAPPQQLETHQQQVRYRRLKIPMGTHHQHLQKRLIFLPLNWMRLQHNRRLHHQLKFHHRLQ